MKRSMIVLGLALVTVAGCGMSQQRPAAPNADAGKAEAYAVLVEMLHSGQPPLEKLAIEGFLESDAPPPRQDIEPLADGPDPRVRAMAVTLLGTMRQPGLVPMLQRKCRDADPAVRLAAAFGLAMAGDASQVTALRDALASPDVTQRRMAAWLLGLMNNPTAVGMLRLKLDDPDAVVVLRTAEALGRLGSHDGLEAVRVLAEHERHEIRCAATRLLGRIGTTADIPRLEKLCQSRFLDVKFAAIAATAMLGDFKRIGMLIDLVDAPEAEIRVLAAWELGGTGYTPAIERLARLMARSDATERAAGAAAILRIMSTRQPWRTRILADQPPPEGPPVK